MCFGKDITFVVDHIVVTIHFPTFEKNLFKNLTKNFKNNLFVDFNADL